MKYVILLISGLINIILHINISTEITLSGGNDILQQNSSPFKLIYCHSGVIFDILYMKVQCIVV